MASQRGEVRDVCVRVSVSERVVLSCRKACFRLKKIKVYDRMHSDCACDPFYPSDTSLNAYRAKMEGDGT